MPEFDCITCSTKLKTADDQVGKFVRCPRCKTTMRVPNAGGAAAAPPPLAAVAPIFAAGGGGARRYGFNC